MSNFPLESLVAKAVEAVGYEFYSMSLSRHNSVDVLRVYIDSENGVNLADCMKADKQIKLNLFAHDYDPGNYNIEISSPGLTRDLIRKEHFAKVVGKTIKVKYKSDSLNATCVGKLLAFDGDNLVLQSEEVDDLTINFDNVIKSSLCLEVK